MIGVSSPGKSYAREQLADFELDQVQQLRVVDHVHLVHEHDDVGHVHLAASRMCSRVCGIGPSAARHHENRAVHLRRARDHVLHVVGVARAVDVRVVALRRLVLHVRRRDRDAALASPPAPCRSGRTPPTGPGPSPPGSP